MSAAHYDMHCYDFGALLVRIPRYYINQVVNCGETLVLPDDLHRHAVQVLRGQVDDPLVLFNGQGGEYHAHFIEVNKKKSSVVIDQFDSVERESSLSIHLVLALIKSDKFDFALQKAVEMGVTSIQPVIAARSVLNVKGSRLEKKVQHWQGVVHSACEQSGRTRIPEILPLLAFNDYLIKASSQPRVAMLPEASASVAELNISNSALSLLIGPEGGFRDDEVELMKQQQVQAIRFGPRILRAETAVVAGLAVCQNHWGDL